MKKKILVILLLVCFVIPYIPARTEWIRTSPKYDPNFSDQIFLEEIYRDYEIWNDPLREARNMGAFIIFTPNGVAPMISVIKYDLAAARETIDNEIKTYDGHWYGFSSISSTSECNLEHVTTNTYTIFKNLQEYGYSNGQTSESSPDAGYIIQKVFELAKDGGKIIIRKGIYHLSSSLMIYEDWHFTLEGEDEYSTVLLYSGEPTDYILQLQGNNQGTKLRDFTLSGSDAKASLIINRITYQSLIELDHLQIGWNYQFDDWNGLYERTDFGLLVYQCDVLRVSNCDIYGNDVAVRIGVGTDMFFTDTDFAVLPIGGERYRIGFWANTVNNDAWGMGYFEGTVFLTRCTNNAPLSTGYHLRSLVHMTECYMENGLKPLVLENAVFNIENSNFMSESGTEAIITSLSSTGFFEDNFVTIHPDNDKIQYLLTHIYDTPTSMIYFKDIRIYDYAGNLPENAYFGDSEHRVVENIIYEAP